MAIVIDKFGVIVTSSEKDIIRGIVYDSAKQEDYFRSSVDGSTLYNLLDENVFDWKITSFRTTKDFAEVMFERVEL